MEGYAYGYITPQTLRLLGGVPKNTELKILVSRDEMNKEHIRENAYMLKKYLEMDGFKVTHIDIPTPGKHPHYDQMATLLFLMEIFGLLALVLSGILVANLTSSILEQQRRQIGILKAIGASFVQITGLYQGMVLALALIAVIISLPIGIFAGRGYAWIAAQTLNFSIYSYSIPVYVFLLELVVGLLVPSLTAAYPILKGSKVTVNEAINDYGIKQVKYSGKVKASIPKKLWFLPRPFLLSLRNTFRRKGRLIFTILVMAIGGAGFITAMNIYSSMYNTVDKKIDTISYDIQVTFDYPQLVKSIEDSISIIPGVTKVEAWGGARAFRVYKDGTSGNNLSIIAPPSAYASSEALSETTKNKESAINAVVVTENHNSTSQLKVAQSLEQTMEAKGMDVSSLIKIDDYRKAVEDHLLLIATFLIIMSMLVVIVGGLGLATSISMNVLDRTREIGIMRAVGSSTYSMTGIIVAEGMIIGVLSWLISMILAWSLSKFVCYNFGMIFFESPLEFAASTFGFAIWLVIVIVFAALASLYPSWKASKMTVVKALSYE